MVPRRHKRVSTGLPIHHERDLVAPSSISPSGVVMVATLPAAGRLHIVLGLIHEKPRCSTKGRANSASSFYCASE
jgi:hypothetical protein